ncbi:hypothetical protein ABZU32_19870 [Sphaerisporangium sp. NPDC005288]|uniref:hypothetical protein n=1 Tax=Sphaerisporangium sp. NPDC005288 TaxID=3155114 RepID=UPI0033B9C09A
MRWRAIPGPVAMAVPRRGRARGRRESGATRLRRLADDTVFLHRFAHGRLVRAAGCTPRGERPYRCDVGS